MGEILFLPSFHKSSPQESLGRVWTVVTATSQRTGAGDCSSGY